MIVKHGDAYRPGEPYEFDLHIDYLDTIVRAYRCFRGGCGRYGGMTVFVADRNTHNHYHNNRGE